MFISSAEFERGFDALRSAVLQALSPQPLLAVADDDSHRLDARVADEWLRRPAHHRLAADRPVLLGHAAAEALAGSGGDDQGGGGRHRAALAEARLARQRLASYLPPLMSRLKPLDIGPLRIETPVILAPMTGVTDMPFRRIAKSYGAGLTVTEMIASQAAIRETRQSLQKAAWDPAEEPVSMQLAGCSPKEMAEAAKLNEDRGAAIIDINMGCPVKKVVNGEAGSALMRDLDHALTLIEATVATASVPKPRLQKSRAPMAMPISPWRWRHSRLWKPHEPMCTHGPTAMSAGCASFPK